MYLVQDFISNEERVREIAIETKGGLGDYLHSVIDEIIDSVDDENNIFSFVNIKIFPDYPEDDEVDLDNFDTSIAIDNSFDNIEQMLDGIEQKLDNR